MTTYQSVRKNSIGDTKNRLKKIEYESNIKGHTLERLRKSSIINDNNCWIWNLRKNTDGYGQTEFKVNGKWIQISVHRLSAHLFLDMPIKSELHVLHKLECKSRACWNPGHLYLGDQSNNSIDAVKSNTHNMTRKTHCNLGHALDGVKLSTRDGLVRYCKECNRNSSLYYRMRKNA